MSERALLFTDVVDSTRLVERLGDARAAEAWSAHDRRARDLLARHRGREIDRADGFFLLFDEARDAAAFALGYHDAIADLGLVARVGLHVGPVTLRENAPADVARGAKPFEVEGLAKPLAARVMALAMGGQCLLTAAARDAMADALPEGARIVLHGHYRFKGIKEPVEVFEIGAGVELAFMPPPDADKAYRVVRSGDMWLPVREVRHNLPAERDTFVGRVHGTACTCRAARRRRAPGHRARPGRHRQDPLRPSLWLDVAGRLARRRVLLRSVRSEFAARDPLRRGRGARCAARPRRPCHAARPRHRRTRTLPRDPRQLRAGGRARGRNGRQLARPRAGRGLRRHEPRAVASAGRGSFSRSIRCRWTRTASSSSRCAPVRNGRTSCSTTPRVRRSPRSCAWSTACRSRSSSRRRACACSRRRNSSCACATASRSCPARAAWRRGRRRCARPLTGRGTC